jgi:hypothetical protein
MEGWNSAHYQFIINFSLPLSFLLMNEFDAQFRANVFGSPIRTPWAKRRHDILAFVTE